MADHVRGNPDAPVVLIEYADFECPYCAMAYPVVKNLAKRFHDNLAEVFREFPLAEIHPHALHAALAAEAAGNQGKFWPMHDILFEHNRKLDDKSLLTYAKDVGLDLPIFERDFADPETAKRITQSLQEGIRHGVQGTPTFFLNGTQLEVGTYDELETLVSEAVRATAAG